MSEPDSTPSRRPPTIDLTAKEVETEPTGSTQHSAAADAAADGTAAGQRDRKNFRGRAKPYAIGVVAGAIAAMAVVAGFWAAGLLAVRETALPPGMAAATSATADEMSSRLDKIQQALQASRRNETIAGRMTTAEAQARALGDSLAALTRRVEEVATATQSALAQAKTAAAAADEAKNAAKAGAQGSDIDALNGRIAALENAVKSLSANIAQQAARADDSAARATIAAEALRATVERGAPYGAELAAVKLLGADQSATAALDPLAAAGIPSAAELGRELAALVPALQHASAPPPTNESVLGRLETSARRLVRITPIDASPAAPGEDPASVIVRIKAAAVRGEIAAALTEIARLPDPVRALAETWVKKAQARERAIGASQHIVATALGALGKPATQ